MFPQILYTDTCFTAQALVRLMVDLNEKALELDRNRDKQEPRFCDVVAIFKLLTSQIVDARQLLEVIIKNVNYFFYFKIWVILWKWKLTTVFVQLKKICILICIKKKVLFFEKKNFFSFDQFTKDREIVMIAFWNAWHTWFIYSLKQPKRTMRKWKWNSWCMNWSEKGPSPLPVRILSYTSVYQV